MASIKDLDNPLLVLILNRLSVQELLPVGHVCVRWNAMRVISAQDRKELLLMIGNDAKRYIDESGLEIPESDKLINEKGDAMFPDQSNVQLKIHSFPLEFVQFLLTNFTSLTTLTISTLLNLKDLDSIIQLLEQFNRPDGTLHTLKLYSNKNNLNTQLNKNQIPNTRTYVRLLSAVNSIGSLRALTFDVKAKFARNSKSPQIHLPILAQLEVFEFNSADDEFFCLNDSITKYAVNNQRLRSIGIHFQTSNVFKLLEQSTEISSRYTHLNLLLYFVNANRFAGLCGHYSNLTSLEITVRGWRYTISTLLQPLTHLPNLISLVINIRDGEILRVPDRDEREIQFELPSVKVLTINYLSWHNNHYFFDKCNMSRVLPNVQVVRISREVTICRCCQMKLLYGSKSIAQLEDHCARNMFRNFANSQHLRMVCSIVTVGYTDLRGPGERRWEWNEIGPFEDEDEEVYWEIEDWEIGDND